MRLHTVQAGRPPEGFSLVELMVIVAIVSILTALLMPTLRNVRLATQNILCQSRMRQIGMATKLYATEERQGLPVAQYINGSGIEQLWPITGRYQRFMNIDPASRSWDGPFMCPTYSQSPSPRSTWDYNAVPLNTSYTVNRGLGQFVNHSGNPMWPSPWWRKPTRLTLIRNPGGAAWLIDGSYRDPMRVNNYGDAEVLTFSRGPTLDRHPGENNNLLFLDGHVKAMTGSQVRDQANRFWSLPSVPNPPDDPMAP